MSHTIPESVYRSSSPLSPTAMLGVVLVHAGLAAVVLGMAAVTILPEPEGIIWTRNIPAPKPAEPERAKPKPDKATQPAATAHITRPVIDLERLPPIELAQQPLPPLDGGALQGALTGNDGTVVAPSDTPRAPVLVGPQLDQRFADRFQPAYPPAMLRLQKEGVATVRIRIEADGRVSDVTLVRADDPAFFAATRDRALKVWRFIPARRDGVAVASEKTLTVRFRLTD